MSAAAVVAAVAAVAGAVAAGAGTVVVAVEAVEAVTAAGSVLGGSLAMVLLCVEESLAGFNIDRRWVGGDLSELRCLTSSLCSAYNPAISSSNITTANKNMVLSSFSNCFSS